MLTSGLIAAGLFNVLWMSGIRAEARRSAESAAISAGHGYLSDDLLRASQQSFEYDGRTARCKEAAVVMSDVYRRQSGLPKLSAHNVRLEWPAASDALIKAAPVVPTRITVAYDGYDNGFHVPLFFGGLARLRNTQIGVSASVSMEHAPYAFRPGPRTSVPMLPFAILDDPIVSSAEATGPSPGHWTQCIESGSGQDEFGWNNDQHQFERGPDGLPEITVTLDANGSTAADALIPLSFCASRSDENSSGISDWIRSGLLHQDLQTLGLKELTYPGRLPPCRLTPQQISSLSVALQSTVGEPRLISLCSAIDPASVSSVKLTRPVAARIIRVTTRTGGSLKVTLQPCVLVTSTAVTSLEPPSPENRYVYSVRLCD